MNNNISPVQNTQPANKDWQSRYHRDAECIKNAIFKYQVYNSEKEKDPKRPNLKLNDHDIAKAIEAVMFGFRKNIHKRFCVIFYDNKTKDENGYDAELYRFYAERWRQKEYLEKVWMPRQVELSVKQEMLEHLRLRNKTRNECESEVNAKCRFGSSHY